MTDEDWLARIADANEVFSPAQPIKEADMFTGRRSQMQRLMGSVFQAGQHAVIYGDRGVGKTSLVNAVVKNVFSRTTSARFFPVQCFKEDDYVSIWERAFKKHQWPNGDFAADDIDDTLQPDSLLEIVNRFNPNNRPVFIFDEFDRIADASTRLKMSETIKLFSDESDYATVVIVGVGRTIADLLHEHKSIERSLRQIEMPRMSEEECRDIIKVRLPKVGMTMEKSVLETIIWLARGMPAYIHIVGMHSALEALYKKKLHIDEPAFERALHSGLEEVSESTRQAYAKAIQSPQTKSLLRATLLACAIAPGDALGSFNAAAVRAPLSQILQRERDIPDFNRHLNAFCTANRGHVLEQTGTKKNFRYRFTEPMVQSFVILMGLTDGLLRRSLSSEPAPPSSQSPSASPAKAP
jgi:Cdc6-like AAA superfamily ATPase